MYTYAARAACSQFFLLFVYVRCSRCILALGFQSIFMWPAHPNTKAQAFGPLIEVTIKTVQVQITDLRADTLY
jgi:hypothetical protein